MTTPSRVGAKISWELMVMMLGFALIGLSLYLAYVHHFKHFYEILLSGLFLVLINLT